MMVGAEQSEDKHAVETVELSETCPQDVPVSVEEDIKEDPDASPGAEPCAVATVVYCERVEQNAEPPAPEASNFATALEEDGDGDSQSSRLPVASVLEPPPEEGEKQEQQPLDEEDAARAQEPMEAVETSETTRTESAAAEEPAVDGGAAKRTVHVLVSDSVAWMRPVGESLESETPAACDVAAVVTPTGAARRKATGVAPRRVVPDAKTAQRHAAQKWPRRGARNGGVSRISK